MAALKKWNEKKEKIDAFIEKVNVPKILNSPHAHLIPFLKKLIGDSNFNISISAIKAIGILAKGLRADFSSGAKELIGPVLTKFREKRQMFIDEINTTLDSFLEAIKLEDVLEDI